MAVLDKHFDHVLIGKNFLSLLMALGLLKRQKKVLLIDDERLRYGESYLSRLCAWEKDFLGTYSEDESINTLTHIENYITPISQAYHIEDRLLVMGESPYLNLIELMRKFPEFLPLEKLGEWSEFMKRDQAQKEFDELFQATIRRLAANSARFSGFERQSVDVFINQCPDILQKVVRLFIERITVLSAQKNETGDLCKTFLYLTQGLFHFQLKISCVSLELFHLFLSLISTQFETDLERLTEDLLEEFRSGGGQFKKTSVREWKFHKLKPWSIELASFDGIVHPQHVSFFGGLPEKLAIRFGPDFQGYRALKIHQPLDAQQAQLMNKASRLKSFRTYVAKKEWIGTNFPWCAHQRHPQGGLDLLIPTPYLKGFKTNFIAPNLQLFLNKELPHLLGMTAFELQDIELTSDIWMQTMGEGAREMIAQRTSGKLSWFDGSGPESSVKLKNINYFGPLNANSFGLISGLGDIKDYQLYQ